MARPMRKAAIQARELIAKGYNVEVVDQIGSSGLSEEEEDALNLEIEAARYEEYNRGVDYEDGIRDESSSADKQCATFLTFDDEDVEPPVVKFRPSTVPGPHLAERITRSGMNNFTRAIDFFGLFMTDEFLETVVTNTNLYAWMNIHDKPSCARRRDGAWNEMCLAELKHFIALIIFNGFCGRKDIDRTWSQATLYSGGWARRFLSRNRFKALSAMLHVSKPGEEDESDKLAKIRPMLNHMKTACTAYFHPRKTLSIDERMVRSKGRSPVRQYMPDKPCRFGYKLWCICDAETGYTFNFNVYVGKSTERSGKGLGYDVVMNLVEPYKHHGHVVHCDNYFSSYQLAKDLLQQGTAMVGTLQPWRKGFPAPCAGTSSRILLISLTQILKGKEWAKTAKEGDMRFTREDGILFLQWCDKKPVTMISTSHRGNDHVLVVRRGRNKAGQYAPTLSRKPSCIHAYNKYMGGVDLADQMIETYNCLTKVRRWWKTLFFHMIDQAVLNAYILFQMWRESNPNFPPLARSARFSHLAFREELVRQLAKIWDDEYPPIYVPALKRKKSMNLTGPHDPHVSKFRRNCQVCYILYGKQVKSYITCADSQCQVHLCLNRRRNCFPTWHSAEFDKHRYPQAMEQ